MSLVRPLAHLRTGARVSVSRATASRAVSSSSTAHAEGTDAPIASSSRSSSSSPSDDVKVRRGTHEHVATGGRPGLFDTILPTTDVRRTPTFAKLFPDTLVHKHINYPKRLFAPLDKADQPTLTNADPTEQMQYILQKNTGRENLKGLVRYAVVRQNVKNMTAKGRMMSNLSIVVAGDPARGLVGIGRGKHEDAQRSIEAAYRKAIMSMDYVNRFESRTLWGEGADLKCKFGATTVIMRARPPGFGLQVPHVLHRLLSAAGIRDASATIEGSRAKANVLAAGIQILHGGFGPAGFGTGTGKKGRKQDKGAGMRSIRDIQLERGRYGIPVRNKL